LKLTLPLFPRDAIIRIKKRSVGNNDARRYGICGASVIEQKQGPLHARDFVSPLICQELISAPGPDRQRRPLLLTDGVNVMSGPAAIRQTVHHPAPRRHTFVRHRTSTRGLGRLTEPRCVREHVIRTRLQITG